MLRLIADHDVTDVIVEGVLNQYPLVDLVRAREAGLARAADAALLEWAARNGRVVVSHDQNTMTAAANERLRSHQPMTGLLIVPQSLAFRVAIEDLAIVAYCYNPKDIANLLLFLPLVKP